MRLAISLLVVSCVLVSLAASIAGANCPPYTEIDWNASGWSSPPTDIEPAALTCSDGKCYDQARYAEHVVVPSQEEKYVWFGTGVYKQTRSATCFPIGEGKTKCTHGMWTDEEGMTEVTLDCPD